MRFHFAQQNDKFLVVILTLTKIMFYSISIGNHYSLYFYSLCEAEMIFAWVSIIWNHVYYIFLVRLQFIPSKFVKPPLAFRKLYGPNIRQTVLESFFSVRKH